MKEETIPFEETVSSGTANFKTDGTGLATETGLVVGGGGNTRTNISSLTGMGCRTPALARKHENSACLNM